MLLLRPAANTFAFQVFSSIFRFFFLLPIFRFIPFFAVIFLFPFFPIPGERHLSPDADEKDRSSGNENERGLKNG